MKYVALIVALALTGCNDTSSKVLTYEELVNYPSQCENAQAQLSELRGIQRVKNFDPDVDNLGEADRAYNSRLKATIWWYTWKCGVE